MSIKYVGPPIKPVEKPKISDVVYTLQGDSPVEAEYQSVKYIDEENWFKNVQSNFVKQTLKAFRIWPKT